MKVIMTSLIVLLSLKSFAGVKFSFQSEEIPKALDTYSKMTGQRFVVDPSVRGKITVIGADDVSPEEAFNLLSSALATNGYAISKQGDTMVVKPARHIQRDLIETSTSLPSLKPERIVTYIYTFKNIPVTSVNRDLRILSSRDGEMSIYPRTNQIIISDWTSNIQRVDQIFKQIDIPTDPKLAKMIEADEKEQAKHRSEWEKKREARAVKMETMMKPDSAAKAENAPAAKSEEVH